MEALTSYQWEMKSFMYELIVNLIKFLMRLYMNKIINEEVIESLEGLLVPVCGWRSTHVTTSRFGFLDVFIELFFVIFLKEIVFGLSIEIVLVFDHVILVPIL